jgi:hypothetical protein
VDEFEQLVLLAGQHGGTGLGGGASRNKA